MSDAIFLWGALCYEPVRRVVLGTDVADEAAELTGYALHEADEDDHPVLKKQSDARAPGLLVRGVDPTARARLGLFMEGVGCRPATVELIVPGAGATEATAWLPESDPAELGASWDQDAWAQRWGAIWCEAAHEAMDALKFGSPSLVGRWTMMKQRGATRLRAAAAPGTETRAPYSAADDVEVITPRRPYTEYFTLEDHDLRFRRFDGSMSAIVRRAGFVGGDAATVVPYDPVLDAVLLVEQFRAGPLMRGDPHPWTLEPIAGRIDPGEAPEDAIHREAKEEAGLEIGKLFPIGSYYPSPGAVTEFVYSYIGLADLAGRGGEIGGVDHEDEDIRTHVLSFERLMELIAAGEVNTGPLILSAYWLAQNRAGLRPSG